MMEKIKEAIFLKKIQLDDNASYLFFLDETGKILKLTALGLEKPSSKNASNLWDYSLITIEYFENRFQNGGRLKRATMKTKNSISSSKKFLFWEMVSNILLLKDSWDKSSFSILLKLIGWNDFEYSWEMIFLFLRSILFDENVSFELTQCSICETKANISSFSMKENGLLCSKHLLHNNPPLPTSTLVKLIKLFSTPLVNDKLWLDFTTYEVDFIKYEFINYMEDILGINLYLLKKL